MLKRLLYIGIGLIVVGIGIFGFDYFIKSKRVKISVIVPVYNRSEYLAECLDSISKQTFDDMEILLIDDGSDRLTADTLDEYVATHKKFKVYHEPHRGVGASRNRGLELAKGKYIGFVDSDDVIHEDFFSEMYRIAEKRKAEVVASPNVPLIATFVNSLNTGIDYSQLTEKGYSIYENMGGAAQWNKIYKADFLRKHNIKSTLYQSTIEDVYFTTLTLMYADEVAISPQAIYYYRIKPSVKFKHDPDFNRIYIFKDLFARLQASDLSEADKTRWHKLIYDRMVMELSNEYNALQTNENRKSFRSIIMKTFGSDIFRNK